jgi:hypothetical protein
MEIWKDIPEFKGFYQASNLGRIRNIERYVKQQGGGVQLKKCKILSPSINRIGYSVCALSVDNKLKSRTVHGLVACAFLGFPPIDCYEINHIDGNKRNNFAENLEWSNRSANLKHAVKLGLMHYNSGEDHWNSKFTNLQRKEILFLRNSGGTLVEIANTFNVFPSTIARIIKKQINI